MLLLKKLRDHRDEIVALHQIKNFDSSTIIDEILTIDDERRKSQKTSDDLKANQNQLAKQIGDLMKQGKKAEAELLKSEVAQLKEQSKNMDDEIAALMANIDRLVLTMPNIPGSSVPAGRTAQDNLTVYKNYTDLPVLPAHAMPHWDLAAKYRLIDWELGVKITGAGFPVYIGKGARLQRALINYFLDKALAAGYTEIQPPIVVNEQSGFGTGQLPDKEGQMYFVNEDGFYLIPTAEVPITNIYRDHIFKADELPVKMMGYTPCFRREAGSYGKDVRGLNRLHQFDKVEIVQFQTPEKSWETLEEMRHYVAGLLHELGLPFRTLLLCGGDMSFTSSMTYDMEVYAAAQQRWLEVSSVSNFQSFQAIRLNCRLKAEDGTNYVHTLNGSALALPRIVASILENNQTPDGIKIPEVLVPYTGFDFIN
ncbi:MAG: serine--tRNA ligase [Bacteroidia bacterium]|nr:serine--tRNA ligase [Bacteroidia bacterium]